tara:strand:+ start:655 stop:1095 length:441 start_codon:yes stop_codon:yes gene_type:complete
MSNKDKEYLLILGIIFSLVYVFWPISELEETIPVVSVEEEPIQVWKETHKKLNGDMGDILKIKYKIDKDNTKLWIRDLNTGRMVHEQPFSMSPYPDSHNKQSRVNIYIWKLYDGEHGNKYVPPGDYEICVGTSINSSENYYLEIVI